MSKRALEKFHRNHMITPDGDLAVNVGRRARASIGMAFDLMGGVESLVDWAEENKGEFYTKLFPRILGKEIEHTGKDGGPIEFANMTDAQLEDHIKQLAEAGIVVDADYEVVDDDGDTDYDDEDY